MRANILYDKFYLNKGKTNVELTFDGMVAEVLKIPSYSETGCCTKSVKNFTFVGLNNDVFQNDLSNMQQAIDDNLIEIPICNQCKKKPKFEREFGNHIFVNVRLIFIYLIRTAFIPIRELMNIAKLILIHSQVVPTERFGDIPEGFSSSQRLVDSVHSYVENQVQRKLNEIPLTLNMGNRAYQLSAVILFEPPRNNVGIGHYTTAVRFNNQWELFDDLRPSTYFIHGDTDVTLHCVLYTFFRK